MGEMLYDLEWARRFQNKGNKSKSRQRRWYHIRKLLHRTVNRTKTQPTAHPRRTAIKRVQYVFQLQMSNQTRQFSNEDTQLVNKR